ncbi:MAG: LytTR family DNA-binding domain-containing protein [Clostridiales bacterium]|nr:LytTR family DNA-binding domain-containing protein [Clostridiales bacterium]
MKIAICDDEKKIRVSLRDKIAAYSIRNNLEISCSEYSTGDELLENYPEQTDVIFLDVEMPGTDGLKTAEEIRKRDTSVIIVFLTAFSSFVFESFKVEAFRYLLKPLKDEEFTETMDAVADRLYGGEDKLNLEFQNEKYAVPYRDILTIEILGHKVWIRCNENTYRWNGSMVKLNEALDGKSFFMPHRSYIINMRKVDRYTNSEITMTDGSTVPLSRRRADAFKEEYIKYWSDAI